MLVRALLRWSAALVLACSVAQAQTWHAVAASPRPALPTVTIDLGYPGPYVPVHSAPITLRATAGDHPFDGYIGFHFRVNQRPTYDTPVIARAVLRPHESWTFSTYANLQQLGRPQRDSVPREIAIEWRDLTMKIRGVADAGVPPWTSWTEPLTLQQTAPVSVLGRSAHFQRPDALRDRAQWYAGFSDLVAPLDVWLDLPRRVREAVLGSGIHVVTFGLPRSGRELDDLDRALLPVKFDGKPGSYRVPWPYGNSETVAVPVSWAVSSGATGIGNGPLPYMVRSAVASWVVDENGVSRPLPATAARPMSLQLATNRSSELDPNVPVAVAWPRPAQLLRVYPAPVLLLGAAVLCLAGWLVARKRPRAALIVALMLSAMFVLAARERIRPPSGVYRFEVETTLSPGVIRTLELTRTYGASPLPAGGHDAETMRTSVTGALEILGDAEIRTSNTPVAMGVMRRNNDWDAITRWSRRDGLGKGPSVRIRSREGKTLVLDYQSASPVNYVHAEWLCGDTFCSGATAVRPGTRGSATINNALTTWREPELFTRKYTPGISRTPATMRVSLVQKTRNDTRILEWLEPAGLSDSGSFLMTDRKMTMNEWNSFTFALPRGVSPAATALVSAGALEPAPTVRVTWASGSSALAPTGVRIGTRSYALSPAALRDILASGSIVEVSVSRDERTRSINPFDQASIEIWEKKP